MFQPPSATPAAPAQPPPNWRQYVELSPDFTPAERAQVERSLDFIASGQNNEGIALLQAASRNSGLPSNGGRILLAPGLNGSRTQEQNGIIRIDFSAEREISFGDERTGEQRQGSLDGTLVHEIFHATQPRRTDILLAAIGNDTSLSAADRTMLQDQVVRLTRSGSDISMAETLRAGSTQDQLLAEGRSLVVANADPRLGNYARALPPIALDPNSIAPGERPIPEREQEATRFAASFLEKNAGDRDPIRRNYQGGGLVGGYSDVISYGPTGELHPTVGDTQTRSAAAIPTSPDLPTVAPVPAPAPSPSPNSPMAFLIPAGLDLSGLAGVSHDPSVMVSRADTGRLALQAAPAQPIERGGAAVAV